MKLAKKVCVPFLLLVAAPAASLAGESKLGKPAPELTTLVVDAAPEPVPALKYQLLVPQDEAEPGNAAPIYSRIVHEQNDAWKKVLGTEPSRFLEMPADEVPLDELGKFLERFRGVSEQLAAAGRRSHCDWDYVIEGQDPIKIYLPDAQFMRNYARLLAVQARYQLLRGELPAAVDTLRDGLELGQHVAEAPFLVNQLIGGAICTMIFGQFDELVQQPGAPNLYWALAALPRPLVSLSRGAAFECDILELKFPELARLDDPDASPAWERLARQLRAWSMEVIAMDMGVPNPGTAFRQARVTPTEEQLADARAYLRDTQGRSADEVEKMSSAEVEVRYSVSLFHELCDEWRKWLLVPYPAAEPRLADLEEKLKADAMRRELIPLMPVLIPASSSLMATAPRLDRHVARQQVVEALRMHAAATGSLPKSLDEIEVVPVPVDPMAGKPFQYTLDADVAVLDVADTPNADRRGARLPVRIQLRAR